LAASRSSIHSEVDDFFAFGSHFSGPQVLKIDPGVIRCRTNRIMISFLPKLNNPSREAASMGIIDNDTPMRFCPQKVRAIPCSDLFIRLVRRSKHCFVVVGVTGGSQQGGFDSNSSRDFFGRNQVSRISILWRNACESGRGIGNDC